MPSIHSDYIFQLFELFEKKGVSPFSIIDEAKITFPKTGMVDVRILGLVLSAVKDNNEFFMSGLTTGMLTGVSNHGFLGYAAKSCETIHQALVLDERYISNRVTDTRFQTQIEGGQCSVYISLPIEDLAVKRFLIELLFASLISFYNELFPNDTLPASVYVDYSCPTDVETYKYISGVPWNFSADACYITFPSSLLLTKISTFDSSLLTLLETQCAEQNISGQPQSISQQVIDIIKSNLKFAPSVTELANQLMMNERTLKRKLASEGQSYREILIQARKSQAEYLLENSHLTIDEIAFHVGYESPSTFKRMFKSWTGKTPGSYRN